MLGRREMPLIWKNTGKLIQRSLSVLVSVITYKLS
jgi:hypothetical protein